jgi:hypothetical protein
VLICANQIGACGARHAGTGGRVSQRARTLVRTSFRGLAFKGFDNGYFLGDLVGIFADVTVFDQIGNERVQTINRDELFREVERRSKEIYAPIDVIRIRYVITRNRATKAEDAGARSKYGVPLRCFLDFLAGTPIVAKCLFADYSKPEWPATKRQL